MYTAAPRVGLAAVLARLHHVALPLWTVSGRFRSCAAAVEAAVSSLLSSPLVGLYLLIQSKRTPLMLQMFDAAS
jgi:hypothetical protein